MNELLFVKSVFIKNRWSIFDGDRNIGNIVKKSTSNEHHLTLYTKPCHTEYNFCSLIEAKAQAQYLWHKNQVNSKYGIKAGGKNG